MRPVAFAALCLVPLAACEPDAEINPTPVQWMEWPAEVVVATPFAVRLLVMQSCAATGFRPGASANESAVTFAPYFLETRSDVLCLQATELSLSIAPGALDTVGTAPGLPADFPRTFEMRATADVFAAPAAGAAALPVRTFGEVTVRLAAPDPSRRNAAGRVSLVVESPGCVRIRPYGAYQPEPSYVLDEPADTAGVSGAFVRGYLYEPAAPLCGEARVFHLVSRN
ncbi:MAG: hypothetical protein Q8Q14_08070 [Gemmatimonadales bacterium]|nr:hypothetical protein [Gemmatimonadales bacterium]